MNKIFSFGKHYIIPKPFDPRLIYEIPPAVAKAAIESGVAQHPIKDWKKYKQSLMDRMGISHKLLRSIHNRAMLSPKKVVFAEADHLDVLKAAQIAYEEGIAIPILLGDREKIAILKDRINFDDAVNIINPRSEEQSEMRNLFAERYWKENQRKGITLLAAQKMMLSRNAFAVAMVENGYADTIITGYSQTYKNCLEPIFNILKRQQGIKRVAATNLMLTSKGAMFFSDTTLNIDPGEDQLFDITKMTCNLVENLGIKPKVALLSYTNFGASHHDYAKKVANTVDRLHRELPELVVDGPIQADFAMNQELLEGNYSFSKLKGSPANVLIFPNLDAANITYKVVKELDQVTSVGPILLGFEKSAHIVQLGASVDEMVNMIAVAVIDVENKAQ